MNDTIAVILGVGGLVVAIVGMSIGIQGFKKQARKDVYAEGSQDTAMKSDIEYIKRRTDDTLIEVKDIKRCQSEQGERLARVEESAKSAHHRIDDMCEKLK
jgi:hypothetical protein